MKLQVKENMMEKTKYDDKLVKLFTKALRMVEKYLLERGWDIEDIRGLQDQLIAESLGLTKE